MEKSYFSVRLRQLLSENNIKKDQLALRIGVHPKTVEAWLYYNGKPDGPNREKLCQFFGISEAELFSEIPPDSSPTALPEKSVPLISWKKVNSWSVLMDIYQSDNKINSESISTTRDIGEFAFALRIKNTHMSPTFNKGDVIIVDPEIQAENNDYVIVKDEINDEATFRQLKKTGDISILRSLNSTLDDIVLTNNKMHEIIGVVVEKYTRFK